MKKKRTVRKTFSYTNTSLPQMNEGKQKSNNSAEIRRAEENGANIEN